jgi:hypothetical protein
MIVNAAGTIVALCCKGRRGSVRGAPVLEAGSRGRPYLRCSREFTALCARDAAPLASGRAPRLPRPPRRPAAPPAQPPRRGFASCATLPEGAPGLLFFFFFSSLIQVVVFLYAPFGSREDRRCRRRGV